MVHNINNHHTFTDIITLRRRDYTHQAQMNTLAHKGITGPRTRVPLARKSFTKSGALATGSL